MNMGHHAYDNTWQKDIGDITKTVQGVDPRFERHYFHIHFYKDENLTDEVPVSAMTGTFEVKVERLGQMFTVTSGSVTLGTESYDIPNAMGSYDAYHVDFTGVTGWGDALYARMVVDVY